MEKSRVFIVLLFVHFIHYFGSIIFIVSPTSIFQNIQCSLDVLTGEEEEERRKKGLEE